MPLQDVIARAHIALKPTDVEVVIFHWPCNDGIGAAISAWVANPALTFIPLQYDTPLKPDELDKIRDKNVLMIDISFKLDRLIEMRKVAKKIVTLDHHDTAMRDLAADTDSFFIMENSGAMLAWHYFHGFEAPAPRLIRLLEDRDLWRWHEREDSEPLHYAILDKHPGPDYATLSQYLDEERLQALIEHGKKIVAAIRELCIKMFDQTKEMSYADRDTTRQYNVLCVHVNNEEFVSTNFPAFKLTTAKYVSEIAEYIYSHAEVDFVMLWHQLADGRYKISFRSNKPDVHVGDIAQQFTAGGGGHKAAGSATVTRPPLEFLQERAVKLPRLVPSA